MGAANPRTRGSWTEIAATTVVAVAVLGGSATIALRERPFRDAPPVAISTPERLASGIAETVVSPDDDRSGSDTGSGDPSADGPSITRLGPERMLDNGGAIVIRDPSAVSFDPRTAHLPDRAMIEDGPHGPLPKRSADGRRPFDAYARPWSGARGTRVAIVIGGLGVSQTGTQRAIDRLPAEVTLAFASGGNSLDRWMQTARRAGHEIVMQVPLEPFDYPRIDPGRDTLTVEAEAEDNVDRLHRSLSRITNYVGIMNYMGARFVSDEAALTPLMREMAERGLMYLDDGSTSRSRADEVARAQGVPFAAGEMAIDEVRERGEILARLDELERAARAGGFAVATGSAFDVTVDAVAAWVDEARRRGIEIVPVSAVADDPERER